MTTHTQRCIDSAIALFEQTLPAFPPRESKDPVGWPAVVIEITTPVHARVAVRAAADGDIVGIAEVPAESIPRDLIFAVRAWLEQTLRTMPEEAARELTDSEPSVIIDTVTETVSIGDDDVTTVTRAGDHPELAPPSSPTLN